MDNQCTTGKFAPPWSETVTYCEREEGHMGKHQNISKTVTGPFAYKEITWDDSGSARTNPCLSGRFWNECDECGILIADDKTHCLICGQWAPVLALDSSEYIVVDGVLYLENKKEETIIRDTLTVLWFDESRPVLHSGKIYRFAEIPEHYLDHFPDNAKFKPHKSSTGGLMIPYGCTIEKKKAKEFLQNYGRLD